MLAHLLELRQRAIYVALCFFALFILFFFLAGDLYRLLVYPLTHLLPAQQSLIATQITAPVFTPLKLATNMALFLSLPFTLYQLWRFISPGLYQQERYSIRGIIGISIGLFIAGVLFCFYLVLPLMFQLFISAVPQGVRLMPDMTNAMDFIIHMLALFGLCFQVPVLCLLLVRIQLVRIADLKTLRPYMIVLAFILGMLLTPPDVLSQILLALPLCLLYELGILLAIYLS
ncbi:twin-arginine translocase subunit TatC [Legionella sp. km772]|uniref:twin-arginine translocase subunit TatC n=1 Tax=Legionella sp. km772 TaxID=2498111 RepID=UPI000F8DBB68|nr:twin-arginine translocase subunit TatC [Legionella sp. km772]RUR06315.1 twin-arginine translocase subunit TatC [Legionella sp. km772]